MHSYILLFKLRFIRRFVNTRNFNKDNFLLKIKCAVAYLRIRTKRKECKNLKIFLVLLSVIQALIIKMYYVRFRPSPKS